MTTRAKPSRSLDAACRHLFRHLREPYELRKNPLVGAYFANDVSGAGKTRSDAIIAAAIRDAVRRCAGHCLEGDRLEDEEKALRQYAIIVESDLDGTPRSSLAAKLGISARQYTRLQHDIRQRIAVQLSAELKYHDAAGHVRYTDARSQVRELASLAARESPQRALAKLSTVPPSSGDPLVVATAFCLQALIRQRYLGDIGGAHEAVGVARSALGKSPAREPSRHLIEAEIELAAAEIDIETGRHYDRAIAVSNSIAETLEQSGETARWLRLRALSLAAYGDFVMGRHDESRRILRALLADFGASKHAAAQERVELMLWVAVVLAELGRFSESSRILADAWLVAHQADLKLDLIRLDLMHTMMALECGAVSAATQRLFTICCESQGPFCGNLRAQAHAYLARAQMRAPEPKPKDILNSAERALALNANDTAITIEAKVAESFARLLMHDLHGAERAARAADDAAVSAGNRAGRGNALRELARVAYFQGRKRDAKRTVMAAIDAGYRTGLPQQTAQALELAAEILKRPNYRQEAATLRRALALGPLSYV